MKKWSERLKKVEQLAEAFHHSPVIPRYRPRLWPCQPSSVWKLFHRQSMAIGFAQSCKEPVHVFALEKEKAPRGQRIFLVTSYGELWHYYRTYTQSLMHCYEVIPEGAVCKLYFDLEFHKPSNREADGKKMVSMLIQYVCQKLKDVYGVECSATNILSLDSSTEDKFSRHLIFNLQNASFKDNIHVGAFIHAILQPVLDGHNEGGSTQTKRQKHEETDLSFLHVKNKDGNRALFVDLGVYTKNRNFRLYKSSKVGKSAAFSLADDNKFISKPNESVSAEESVFLASLVCNVSFTGQRILMWEVTDAEAFRTTRGQSQQGLSSDPGSRSGCLTSPHREVDDFVLTVVRRDAIQGSIRRWNYFAAEQLLVYDIAKYRWCDNVGRFHKSNNIMIVVDLKEEVWYQKCHDPECRNFRSSSYPLPQEICISYIMMLDEADQAYMMDEAGNIEPRQAPKPAPGDQEFGDAWGRGTEDDREFSDCLDDFELNTEEISDELLLGSVEDFHWQ
ncbi:DNA-directed primase/polymerase protein [Phyllopteryx taeniolatus]|uniref:DNA-directed primase/polymerase protein n=1 Tax=Phyllopteryx taeniolatus TaxID=161469 RepID=UPI002AD23B7C|nr:DNA-directed primase/polymerase protein [Phyllopteryx taeniolatus]XP_061627736.1 DNA-directed primase/polymerase protein [Phyllopteryx taeniolatus]